MIKITSIHQFQFPTNFQVARKLNRWSLVGEERRCLALLRLKLGELLFIQAAVAVADKDFKTAIRLLEEVHQFGVGDQRGR